MSEEVIRSPCILTFGYGNRSNYDILLDYINEFRVNQLIDVRKSPKAWNRKWYGDALEKLCISRGLTYRWETVLGNISGTSQWISPNPVEAKEVLASIAESTVGQTILLLCAEMDCQKCHRVEVANSLKELTNLPVLHLK